MAGKIKIELIINKELSGPNKRLINKNRAKEFGIKYVKDFNRDYEPKTLWIFVKDQGKVVSFGGIRPIKIKHSGKTYNIGGICSTISIKKKKGYGRIMVSEMIKWSKKTGKTILGFTGDEMYFFEKAGLKRKPNFIRRFVYVKSNGEKIYDREGHGIYLEGKDKLISKIIKTKSEVEIPVIHW